jgi:hypothetical protein
MTAHTNAKQGYGYVPQGKLLKYLHFNLPQLPKKESLQ